MELENGGISFPTEGGISIKTGDVPFLRKHAQTAAAAAAWIQLHKPGNSHSCANNFIFLKLHLFLSF